jgi:pimeloyl-ACP methyl ester carboxylesterase
VSVGGRPVRLASDRTTPLAVQVASKTRGVALAGLLRPGEPRLETGLYMVQPPRRGKIPVLLVHGLVADATVWAQAVNHLQNDPVLGDRFQFWVYLYPTGDLLPGIAATLRADLRRALTTIDPGHTDPDLARMVVVGHSIGGVVAQMLVQDSRPRLWDAVFTVPFAELRAPPDVKARLADHLLYGPEPYVRRAVFLATSHAGTPFATRWFARIGEARIRRPEELTETIEAVVRENGPNVIRPELNGRLLNGIGQQAPGYPLIEAINRSGVAPGVIYHSIIPQMNLCGAQLPTDGVVPYWSSHIEGAASEKIYHGRHGQATSAEEATAELKRILHEHLREGGE